MTGVGKLDSDGPKSAVTIRRQKLAYCSKGPPVKPYNSRSDSRILLRAARVGVLERANVQLQGRVEQLESQAAAAAPVLDRHAQFVSALAAAPCAAGSVLVGVAAGGQPLCAGLATDLADIVFVLLVFFTC